MDENSNSTGTTGTSFELLLSPSSYHLIPSIFFWILTPIIGYHCKTNLLGPLPWSTLMSFKWLTGVLIIIDRLFLILLEIWESLVLEKRPVNVEILVFFVFQVLTLITLMFTMNQVRRSGIYSSGPVFCTWMVFTTFAASEFYQLINSWQSLQFGVNYLRQIAYLSFFPLVAVEFLLNFPSDPFPTPEKYQNKKCPSESASFINRMLYSWFSQLISLGNKKTLEVEDVFEMDSQMEQEYLKSQWKREWARQSEKAKLKQAELNEKRKRAGTENVPLLGTNGVVNSSEKEVIQPSMILTLWQVLKWEILGSWLIKLLSDVFQFANPLILNYLITFIETPTAPLSYGIALSICLFLTGTAKSFFINQFYFAVVRLGAKIQTMLSCAIYEKAILLSNTARKERTIGEMVNLLSIDVDRFRIYTQQIQQYWSSPLQIIICMIMLWQTVGVAVWAGIFVMISLVPINFVVSVITRKWQVKLMEYKDERIRLISEVLNGIKVVKLSAWESAMEESIEEIRRKELKMIRDSMLLKNLVDSINVGSPVFVALATFAVFLLVDDKNVLTPNIAFVSLSLFNLLRNPLMGAAELVSQTVQVIVSNKRVRSFLSETEVDLNSIQRETDGEGHKHVVEVKGGSFSWDTPDTRVLNDIDFTADSKQLISVVGSVGSGKSSLLLAALGEMEKITGHVGIRGSVAYYAQQPWILNQTLKNNILMGADVNEARYKKVTEACALASDFKQLSDGDKTEIGEKGINLSGGQKARIALARVVYQGKDVYFLDDPLSAVDAHVGKHIFDNVIGPNGLLANSTRIFVTNNTSFLHESDKIVVIKDGRIKHSGTYDELMADESAREYLQEGHQQEINDNEVDEEDDYEVAAQVGQSGRMSSRVSRQKSQMSVAEEKKAEALIAKEEAATGRVKVGIYMLYFKAMGLFAYVLPYFLAAFLNIVFAMARSLWLSNWSDQSISPDHDTMSVSARLGVYAILGVTEVVFLFLSLILLLLGGVAASRNLHRPLLHNTLRNPVSYFDVTPIGRIINRFAKDMEVVDIWLGSFFRFMVIAFMNLLQIVIIIAYSTPWFVIVIIPVLVIYFFILKYFITSTRQMERMSSVTRSPIFSNFSETLQGISTIRSFQWNEKFIERHDEHMNTHVRCNYYSQMSNRWLTIRLELLGNAVIFAASILAILGKEYGITAGLLGLSVSCSLNITFLMNVFIRGVNEVEKSVTSVERIEEYTHTKNEAEWRTNSDKLPIGWPTGGAVKLENYSCRYRDELDLVLNNISIDIKPGQKVGVCGRTGAGKSSLALSLFRIVEAAEGQIQIDGTVTSQIGLHDLREKLTIIPQENVLFANTLRFNIDPKNEFSDAQIWTALENSHLKGHVEQLPQKLESAVAEGGENFSVGQRQLLCLTRALLRKSHVLVLDEATSGIDNKTDAMVQATIREEFAHSTIITIAHRLHTIIDYDRIIVLDKGKIVEDGPPGDLLKNKNSIFYGFAKSAKLVG